MLDRVVKPTEAPLSTMEECRIFLRAHKRVCFFGGSSGARARACVRALCVHIRHTHLVRLVCHFHVRFLEDRMRLLGRLLSPHFEEGELEFFGGVVDALDDASPLGLRSRAQTLGIHLKNAIWMLVCTSLSAP